MLADYSFNKLELNSNSKPFTCGKDEFCDDLNEFFHKDAAEHLKQKIQD